MLLVYDNNWKIRKLFEASEIGILDLPVRFHGAPDAVKADKKVQDAYLGGFE